MNVGFIGAGKVGTALGRYYIARGIPVTGYSSLHSASAQRAAERTKTRAYRTAAELACASDVVFLTVPDSAIADAWHSLRAESEARVTRSAETHPESPLSGTIVCHCSGCAPASVIDDAHEVGALVASVHPLCAISSPLMDLDALERMHITLEGDDEALRRLRELLSATGNPLHVIDASYKTLYHAAAVFASNLVLATLDAAVRTMCACGFDSSDARDALSPLIRGNVESFIARGAEEALTGPVERNDVQTVARHAKALSTADPKAAVLYAELTRALIDIATAKHPERDYAKLRASL